MARVATDQRALEVQRNAVASAESTLGDAVKAVQDFRTLVVQAGNSALPTTDRASIAQQMTSLRDQILGYANTQDSNGLPLFGGLGSTASPFVDVGTRRRVQRHRRSERGGRASRCRPRWTATRPGWTCRPATACSTSAQAAGTSAVWTDAGQVTDPAALTGHGYSIEFSVSRRRRPPTT